MTETGIWSIEEASKYHDFSYRLAKFIGDYLPKSEPVIDFGCGRGSYLRYLHDRGFESLHGIEGEALPFFEFSNVAVQDLTKPFNKDPIGNSICLEVGEHIPSEYTGIFLDNLVQNTKDKLILSWAIPGQQGIGHVNCQPNSWVILQVCDRGMAFILEDTMEVRKEIEGHYEYFRNTLLIFRKL